MTVYGLINRYNEKHGYNGHFFDRETLRFCGEHVSEMRVLKGFSTIRDGSGVVHKCYCLSSLQRKAPGGPRRKYSYFDVETFDHTLPDID